jgi:hypothetical protein
MAPEIVIDEKGGIKSDIRSFVPDFIEILGATDPYNLKNQHEFKTPEYFQAQYDLTGLFEGYDMPDYPIDIKPYIVAFINRMQADRYDDRPDSDEVLRFFTTLDNFCKTYDESLVKLQKLKDTRIPQKESVSILNSFNDDLNSLKVYGAKLAVLSAGHWNRKIGEREIVANRGKKVKLDMTFEQYDFDADPKKIADEILKQPVESENLVSKDALDKIKQEIDRYTKKRSTNFFRNKQLTTLKRLIGEAFLDELLIVPTHAAVKNYRAMLTQLDKAVEELTGEKNPAYKNLNTTDEAKLKELFRLIMQYARQPNTKDLKTIYENFPGKNADAFTKAIIDKLTQMQDRHEQKKDKARFGKGSSS